MLSPLSTLHVLSDTSRIATPYQVHVSAAKAGVDALSAVLAVEEGPHGVRSNVIAPGPIGGTDGADRLGSKAKGSEKEHIRHIPAGREGSVKDIANAGVYLFSEAAGFVSGVVLVVDGATEHIRPMPLPYPEAVLDPKAVLAHIKPRM